MENFWQACSHKLEQELTPQQYSAWIKPLVPLDFEDGLLRIAAPNRFKLDWVKTQFANRITALACEYWDAPTEVQFVLDPRGNQGRRPAANAQANGGGASGLGLPNHEQLHLSGTGPAGARGGPAPGTVAHQPGADLRQPGHR
jgi:chromosomal replication initiator protein